MKATIIRNITLAAAAAAAILSSQSCLKDNGPDYSLLQPNAVVTVKPLDETGSTFYIQLDDSTALKPTNMTSSPYGGKEVRAFVNISQSDEPTGVLGFYSGSVKINWIDSLLTKNMAADLRTADNPNANDDTYGTDPVEIINGFPTVVEDGYMTLGFTTLNGRPGAKHWLNLVYTGDPDATDDKDKYVVEFKHDADGDTSGRYSYGYVAFRLSGVNGLPDTEGDTVTLTLKWNSFSGTKSAEFDYCTR